MVPRQITQTNNSFKTFCLVDRGSVSSGERNRMPSGSPTTRMCAANSPPLRHPCLPRSCRTLRPNLRSLAAATRTGTTHLTRTSRNKSARRGKTPSTPGRTASRSPSRFGPTRRNLHRSTPSCTACRTFLRGPRRARRAR